eukprot:8523250-Pyramimonas_sp.AAC.1
MIGIHKRAARAGIRALLQQQHEQRRRQATRITPQKAYMTSLNEQLYTDTMADTIKRRLLP